MPHRGVGLDEVEALSGSFATVLGTQPSMENHSGSLCALSINTEDESTLTVVPVVGNVSLSTTSASIADQQTPGSRRRLFFAHASSDTTEERIKQWLSQFGVVESVQLLNGGNGGLNSGCGYITMGTDEQAAAALAAMQQNPQLPSPVGFLNVGYPLTEDVNTTAASAGTGHVSSLVANAGRTVFFAKVPPTALDSEVELLFSSFGKLSEVNLFRAWAGAKHSKGCGLITYVDRACAANAIAQLHGKYVFPGSDCPMVVEWMDLKKQRPVAPPPPADKPPLGCAHDAYKLLLGNLPLSVTEADLAAVLRQFGHVVQLALTQDSSGASASGHVWYATKQAADALQNRVKAEPIWFRDARTNQELALCVRRSRKPGTPAPPRQNVVTPNGAQVSNSSNSSSCLLPLIHVGSSDISGQLAQMQRVVAAQGGMDISLPGPEVVRLLPMQHISGPLHQAPTAGGYMASDVCEAMLDVYDTNASIGLGMPVHLQPAIAAQQMASGMALQAASQQRTADSPMYVLTNGMLHSSGQHCMSAPANLMVGGLNEFEGSFNMSLSKGMNNQVTNMQPTVQQIVATGQQQLLQQNGGLMWQQQQQQRPQQQQLVQMSQAAQRQLMMVPGSAGMAAQASQLQLISQQQHTSNSQITAGNASTKSIAIPIEAYEVQLIAENLVLLSASSGAQVTITPLPGASLAIMITGRPDQVAAAQQLLASVRNRS